MADHLINSNILKKFYQQSNHRKIIKRHRLNENINKNTSPCAEVARKPEQNSAWEQNTILRVQIHTSPETNTLVQYMWYELVKKHITKSYVLTC